MKIILLGVVVCVLLFGCASAPLRISTSQGLMVNKDYEVLGEGEGEASGIMLFQLIPIGQNDRFELAYERAVKSKGGDRLIDPVIRENWAWLYICNVYTTRVKGTVVKDIRK